MGANWPIGPALPKQIEALASAMGQIAADVHALAEMASAPKLRTVDPEPIWQPLPWDTVEVINLTGLIVSSSQGGLFHLQIGNSPLFYFRIAAGETITFGLSGLGHIVVSRGLPLSVINDTNPDDVPEATAVAMPRDS